MGGCNCSDKSVVEVQKAKKNVWTDDDTTQLKGLFVTIDTNKDGFCDLNDLQTYFKEKYSPDMINGMIKYYDAKDDTKLSFDQFMKMWQELGLEILAEDSEKPSDGQMIDLPPSVSGIAKSGSQPTLAKSSSHQVLGDKVESENKPGMMKSGSQPLLAAQLPGSAGADKMVGGTESKPSGNEISTSQQQAGDSGLHPAAEQLGLE